MENLKESNEMIGQYAGTYNLHSHVIKVCIRALQSMAIMTSMLVSGCAVSTTPILDQEFGKSMQLNKDIQRIPVDPSKAQSAGSINAREVRVYVDSYIKGGVHTGNTIEAPITAGANK